MFVGILLRDPARDFGMEFESLRHREIFEISAGGQKTVGSHLKTKENFTTVKQNLATNVSCTVLGIEMRER